MLEEVGFEVTRFKVGDRVVAPFNHGCGLCEYCSAGRQNVCSDLLLPGVHYTGGHAELTEVGRADVDLVHLPESIPFAVAARMGCRYVTPYHGVVDQDRVGPGEWVAVFACGGVDLSAVDITAGLGANVIVVSRSPERLALAEKLGATHTVTAGDDAPNRSTRSPAAAHTSRSTHSGRPPPRCPRS